MSITHPPVTNITGHCAALSKLLHALSYQEPSVTLRGDETYGWSQPAEWLDLAASVVKVDVLTAQGDTSLMLCGRAMEYENKRSDLLSQFVTSVTVFNFAYGAFESVAKLVDPPSIPRADRKNGNDKLVARIAYAIRSIQPDGVYHCALANIRHRMTVLPEYSDCLPAGLGPVTEAEAGEGIDLVKRIRNKFAHGAAALPEPDEWDGKDTYHNQLVQFSCRMVLLTIQMVLRVHFAGRSLDIECYEPGSDDDVWHDIHSLLQTLHLVTETLDDDLEDSELEEDEPDATDQPVSDA